MFVSRLTAHLGAVKSAGAQRQARSHHGGYEGRPLRRVWKSVARPFRMDLSLTSWKRKGKPSPWKLLLGCVRVFGGNWCLYMA